MADVALGPDDEISRQRRLSRFWTGVVTAASLLTVAFAIYTAFNLGAYTGFVFFETIYFYGLLGLLFPLCFILYPASAKASKTKVPLYDVILFASGLGACGFCLWNAERILNYGWEFVAPQPAIWVAMLMWALVLEGTRRTGGLAVFVVVLVISFYPVTTNLMPGILNGEAQSLANTAIFHVYGTESVIGIPLRAFAQLVIGFLIFGVTLQHTGGGKFFLDLSFALLGSTRGGPAKVAIFSSGLMGSVSGSVVTNVLTTGVMTIPTMRRVGFRPTYAAGVEACASTGGVLMPPIMGATAFVMATFLDVPYIDIVYAAIIPSLLYFLALFIQIDGYAARYGLVGLPPDQLPKIGQVIKQGWYYLAAFVLLIWMLLVLKQEQLAPYYSTALLLVINQFIRRHRWGLADLHAYVLSIGQLFVEICTTMAGIGLIIGALLLTGKIGSLAYELVAVAGDSTIILLLMGALTSFILGMGMTVTAAYIFLAVTLAPALTAAGLDRLAVHMFILYWGMLSYITPPVAIGAFAAASVARASPMHTAFEAMRLGSIIYFVPFFFVLNPALIGHGTAFQIATVLCTALVGVLFLAAGLQGYLIGVGSITGRWSGWPLRVVFFIVGLLLILPGGGFIGYSAHELLGVALLLAIPAIVVARIRKPQPTAHGEPTA